MGIFIRHHFFSSCDRRNQCKRDKNKIEALVTQVYHVCANLDISNDGTVTKNTSKYILLVLSCFGLFTSKKDSHYVGKQMPLPSHEAVYQGSDRSYKLFS